MSNLVISELHNSKIRRSEDEKYSALDIIRVLSGRKNPGRTLKELCMEYNDLSTKLYYYKFKKNNGALSRKTPCLDKDGVFYLIGLLPGKIGNEYREKAANLVRRYIEGDADLGLEIFYRDKNKQRQERAERRLQVAKTNKQVATLVGKDGNVSYSTVHNDRYKGLYQKTASELRTDCGAKPKETPLNYMSEIDLTFNLLANQVAIKKNNPGAIFSAANGLRDYYRQQTGEDLAPQWVEACLPPKKARKALNGQLEIPLFS